MPGKLPNTQLTGRAFDYLSEQRGLAYIHCSADLRIVDASPNFWSSRFWITDRCAWHARPRSIPDLAGADAHLHAILRGECLSYRMERINQPQPNGGRKSYDLTILPFLPDNPQHGLFILVEDATPLGVLEQSLAQVRNALDLTPAGADRG